jgi:hypothetical protein
VILLTGYSGTSFLGCWQLLLQLQEAELSQEPTVHHAPGKVYVQEYLIVQDIYQNKHGKAEY